jgi:flagellar hook-length control protein FliK
VEKTAKTQLSTPVSANDVLKQVVEKAKVILNGDKSEMIMDLKPDNLGKLSLKVVTERGMVMARFIAENQQVKEVLETNMQLLKDALEKQGMQIQEFSVSVGQQSAGGFNNSYGAPQEKGRRSAHPAISGAWQEGTAGIESAAKANAYSWTGSTVNYTA